MTSNTPFNVSEELAKLRHEKKNGQMPSLPSNATVQKRPIIHAAVASPLAGAGVQKVVYVSSKTPFMSAVKRVKKLLGHVEKRATQNVGMVQRGDREAMRKLVEASDKVAKDREEVVVKASGKAIAKALNVGEWFSNKEKDISCNVEVRSGSVSVVDDVVELEPIQDEEEEENEDERPDEPTTELEAGDTTMELFGENVKANLDPQPHNRQDPNAVHTDAALEHTASKKKRRRRKRSRPTYEPDDLPEQRLRWVKTVEVSISLKG